MASNNSAFDKIDKCWEKIKDIGLIVQPCRVSFILLVAVMAFLIGTDQGQDVLRAMTEMQSGSYMQIIWFFGALLLWAINTWYWTRVMLRFDFGNTDEPKEWRKKTRKFFFGKPKRREKIRIFLEFNPPTDEQEKRREKIRKYLPRFLGTLTFLITALAFYKTSGANSNMHLYFSIACLVFAAVFLYVLIKRLPLQHSIYEYISSKSFAQKK